MWRRFLALRFVADTCGCAERAGGYLRVIPSLGLMLGLLLGSKSDPAFHHPTAPRSQLVMSCEETFERERESWASTSLEEY
jgi:hypothetical protein